MPVTMPAEGSSPSYICQAASGLSSRKGEPASTSPSMRSRARQLAPAAVQLHLPRAAAGPNLGQPRLQLLDQRLHPGLVVRKVRVGSGPAGADNFHVSLLGRRLVPPARWLPLYREFFTSIDRMDRMGVPGFTWMNGDKRDEGDIFCRGGQMIIHPYTTPNQKSGTHPLYPVHPVHPCKLTLPTRCARIPQRQHQRSGIMAELVLGLASSHSPQLSTPPEGWAGRGGARPGQPRTHRNRRHHLRLRGPAGSRRYRADRQRDYAGEVRPAPPAESAGHRPPGPQALRCPAGCAGDGRRRPARIPAG